MRSFLHLAALAPFALANALAAAQLVHSPQVTLHHKPKPTDYSWLWTYTEPEPDGNENALAHDPRFPTLLRQQFPAPQSFWGEPGPVSTTAVAFLSGPPGRVLADGNRYLSADGCEAHACMERGLLFADLGTSTPLFVFAAQDWISENRTIDDKNAAYSLWVFPSRVLDPAHLPAALVESVTRWSATPAFGDATPHNITRVFLVDPDGTPHTLAPATIGAHNDLPPETTTDSEVHP